MGDRHFPIDANKPIKCKVMELKRITLREAVEVLARHGYEVMIGDVDLETFLPYYDHHYAPNMKRENCESIGRFFADDMNALFKE